METQLKKRLKDEGFFNDPQVTVSVETYKSQKLFIVGEVRTPGSYPLVGRHEPRRGAGAGGSTLPTAGGEVVIVRAAAGKASGPVLPTRQAPPTSCAWTSGNCRTARSRENAALRDGDTIFVPRAESVYVFGQVKNPGAYALQQKNTSVMQALSLAGGLTNVGSSTGIRIAASTPAPMRSKAPPRSPRSAKASRSKAPKSRPRRPTAPRRRRSTVPAAVAPVDQSRGEVGEVIVQQQHRGAGHAGEGEDPLRGVGAPRR